MGDDSTDQGNIKEWGHTNKSKSTNGHTKHVPDLVTPASLFFLLIVWKGIQNKEHPATHPECANLRQRSCNPNPSVTCSGSAPKSYQFLLVIHRTPPKNIIKFVNNFLSCLLTDRYIVGLNKQNKQSENIPFLEEVKKKQTDGM